MPVIRFTPKKCNKFYSDKCDCSDCKKINSSNSSKKKLRFNTYGLKFLEGLPPFYISKL